MLSYLFLLLIESIRGVCVPQPSTGKSIQLATGQYTGDVRGSTTTYYAIPYAFADRFEPPRPIDEKPGISPGVAVNASTHGPGCINFKIPPPYDEGFAALSGGQEVEPQSEDCLTLDVYVPNGNHQDLPVLIYTPGGGFLVGASFLYDMSPMVEKSIELGQPFIAVSINYRLGPLGFLNPSIWGEEINLGLLDQVEALRWVQKNIYTFGGDPEKVTISGESAGAESAMHQLLWTDENLFRAAWIMSVPSTGKPFLNTEPSNIDPLVRSYAEACGCPAKESLADAVGCLRKTDVSILVNESVAWQGSQTSLGGIVRRNVFEAIRAGAYPKVPILVSTTRDEGTALAFGFHPDSIKPIKQSIENLIYARGLEGRKARDFMTQMLEAYPNDPALGCPYDGLDTNYGQGSQYKRLAAIDTDVTWTEPWVEYLATFSKRTTTFGMLWVQPIPGLDRALGVIHGSDLYYYFPFLAGTDKDPRRLGYGGLVDAIHTAVSNFVSFGSPNGCAPKTTEAVYTWPEYGHSEKITVMNASRVAFSSLPPSRPGFDVIHKFLRPGHF